MQQEETLASIKELGGRHTVLFSSHQLSDVEKVCDRVIIITRGRIHFDGMLSDIREAVPGAVIEARGPRPEVEKAIRRVVGVTDVGGDGESYDVKANANVWEAVAQSLHASGHPVRRLEPRREKLEDIYMRYAVRGE